MSDVGKIISDIIQITSDLFSPPCSALVTRRLQNFKLLGLSLGFQCFAKTAGVAGAGALGGGHKKAGGLMFLCLPAWVLCLALVISALKGLRLCAAWPCVCCPRRLRSSCGSIRARRRRRRLRLPHGLCREGRAPCRWSR